MERTVYTWGYSTDRTTNDLLEAVGGRMPVFDIRRSRQSRNRHWNGSAAANDLFGIYDWMAGLGNAGRTFRWEQIDKRYAEAGLLYCAWRLVLSGSIVLVCAEADHERCHRTQVAERIAQLCGAKVVHL